MYNLDYLFEKVKKEINEILNEGSVIQHLPSIYRVI